MFRKSRSLLTQTVNISRSGMLLRAPQGSFEVGERFNFQLSLGKEGHTVGGKAEVVRIAKGRRDAAPGLGVRFVSFQGRGGHKLEEFLEEVLAS
jgi:c-di-GMP-binding flagellar brake protein YcgR